LLERRADCETTFGFTKTLKSPDLARPFQVLLAGNRPANTVIIETKAVFTKLLQSCDQVVT
jgi:hypothetical protein